MSNTSLLGAYGDNSGSALMFRNVLINGGFDVWQRGTTADSLQANGDAGGYGAADRWKFGGGDAATIYDHGRITQTTITTLGGFRFGVKLTAKFTSCKTVTLAQFVEAANVQHLAGTQCTFSFYARKLTSSSETSNLRITVGALATTDTSGNIVNTPSAFNDSFDSGNIALSSVSTSWQRYTYTFTLSSNATRGVCVKFNVFNASNIGAFDLIEVTGTQLEAGPVATPFERRPIGTELALCQRYYEKSYELEDKPGTDVNLLTPLKRGGLNFYTHSDGSSDSGCMVFYKVTKRKSNNTVTTYTTSGTANNLYRTYSGGSAAVPAFIGYNSSNSVFVLADEGGVPAWSNTLVEFCWTCDAEL